jgi:hypothetical protein
MVETMNQRSGQASADRLTGRWVKSSNRDSPHNILEGCCSGEAIVTAEQQRPVEVTGSQMRLLRTLRRRCQLWDTVSN